MPKSRHPAGDLGRARTAALALALAGAWGCSTGEAPAIAPDSRPVKTFLVAGGENAVLRAFPGRVDADQRAELSFRVSGRLQEILVREGDLVEAGQVVARLDPTDYEIVLEDREATYENTRRNFERARELIVDGNISRMDFDRMEANYRSAAAALSQARKDLEYTVMTAPFRGRIAQRRFQNFQEVVAKQTVFWLQNIEQLEVVIDIPESIVRMVRNTARDEPSIAEDKEAESIDARVRFDGREDLEFPLRPKEITTKADDTTQTFRATFTMDAPSELTVLPGMTATVVMDLSDISVEEPARWVPVRAVQADSGLEPRVWVLDADTMTVATRPVNVGRMAGRMIEVTDGLEGGEEIVAVGAPYLAEGMRVTRMAASEQAVPRADDPG